MDKFFVKKLKRLYNGQKKSKSNDTREVRTRASEETRTSTWRLNHSARVPLFDLLEDNENGEYIKDGRESKFKHLLPM